MKSYKAYHGLQETIIAEKCRPPSPKLSMSSPPIYKGS